MNTIGLDEVKTRLGKPSWQEVPFMTKEDLRSRSYALSSWPSALHWFSSSGTTALPVVYPWTTADEEIAQRALHKIHPSSEKMTMTGGTGFVIAPTGLPGMWSHMDRQLRHLGLVTALPGVEPMRIFDLMTLLQPRLMISLPLVLSRLGELRAVLPHLQRCSPEILFTGGDVLSDSRRSRIEKIWSAKLRNFYGLSEVFGPMAGESDDPSVLAWQVDEVFVEILDPTKKTPIQDGETGVAVITTLWSRPAALVRYWTGDYFRLINWLAPGRPAFQVRGREGVSLPGLKRFFFPVDVDDVLLADPASGLEWTVEAHGHEVLIIVETTADVSVFDRLTVERLQGMFDRPIRLVPVMPGALDRSNPKLGVVDSSPEQE
jgi:phenylacetate-coenzyme A ligase PaaK-like adenylate-forming protein